MAAGTDDCASEEEEEEEEGGRQPPVGVGTTSRYSFFGGSDNISIMMLDESDRDLIAARLAVLEASAEDIIWVCAEAMCNCT